MQQTFHKCSDLKTTVTMPRFHRSEVKSGSAELLLLEGPRHQLFFLFPRIHLLYLNLFLKMFEAKLYCLLQHKNKCSEVDLKTNKITPIIMATFY